MPIFRSALAILILCASLAAQTTRPRFHEALSEGHVTRDYIMQAMYGVRALQDWYNPATGLYQKPADWWNSANAITVLVDYSRVTHTTQYLPAVANTFAVANHAYGTTSFINESNDDEGWWALAWVDAYDLTHNPAYLAMAETIFADLTTQWDSTTCNGGVWWSKDLKHSAYKNAIVNEIFLSLAASLANRVPAKHDEYLRWARKEWQWFRASGMINEYNLVNDGLNASNPKACTNNGEQTWTYNQGVILGALTELAQAADDPALLEQACKIADAAILFLTTKRYEPGNTLPEDTPLAKLPPVNILVDRLRPGQAKGADMPQFKGIFVRNLAQLYKVAPKSSYKYFARWNASTILRHDQDPSHHFGCEWQGPYDSADATRQASALDALLAAIQMQ